MEYQKEEWRPVVGYEGLYEVSNQNGFKNAKLNTFPKGRINKGYRTMHLGKYIEKRYHVLVVQAFPEICGEYFQGCSIHHKNHNRLDNRPENLIVLTKSEHSKLHYQTQPDSFKKPSEKRSKSISKALAGRRAYDKHIPVIQLSKNGEIVKKWDCMADINKEYGYSAGNICSACKGRLKTAYGFKWQYAVS